MYAKNNRTVARRHLCEGYADAWVENNTAAGDGTQTSLARLHATPSFPAHSLISKSKFSRTNKITSRDAAVWGRIPQGS